MMKGKIDSGSKLNNQHRNRSFLPEELIIDILVRLPVESLLRFKSVCRYWHDLITGSDFVYNHFDHHSYHSRLVVYHRDLHHQNMSTVFSTFPDEKLAGETPSHHRLKYLYMPEHVEVIGPVNGIFCLSRLADEPRDIYAAILVNPATRECKPLFVPDFSASDPAHWDLFQMFGFGLDTLTGDLKVVSMWCWDQSIYRKLPSTSQPRAAVYSLANDSWTYHDLDPFITLPRRTLHNSGTPCINGSCFWLLKGENNYYLRSFHLSSDVIRETKGPEYTTRTEFEYPRLVLYNESLAMLLYKPLQQIREFTEYIDVMVMKEEGYWTKDVTIDVRHLQMNHAPLGFWKNNSLILHRGGDLQLILYDPNTCEVKELGIHKQYIDASPFSYIESLISLNGENIHHGIKHVFDFRTPPEYKSHNQSKREEKSKEERAREEKDKDGEDKEF